MVGQNIGADSCIAPCATSSSHPIGQVAPRVRHGAARDRLADVELNLTLQLKLAALL